MHILFCVNNIKFGTKCFVKVEQFVLPFIFWNSMFHVMGIATDGGGFKSHGVKEKKHDLLMDGPVD